jgi:hypothetical protein
VTYNTATADPPSVTTARPGVDIILESIGEESRKGIAKPVDVLLLQEQYTMATSTQSIVDILNGIYGTAENPKPYARGTLNGATLDSLARGGRPGIVYNTQTVQLVQETSFGTISVSAQPRATLRYRLRPVGYDASADFYAYNSHTKADDSSADEARRLVEAQAIRANYNTLPSGSHAIYAGDLNLYSSTEDAFQWLTMPGSGQVFDPINRVGSWHNNSSFSDVHTQSPCNESTAICVGINGGMDDRFDFQLLTTEFLDNQGLRYLPGSYRAFGSNGSTYNQNINQRNASNQIVNTYQFRGVTSFTNAEILDALWGASDHLPVVADYQLPAVMQVVAGDIPTTLSVGQAFTLAVTVSNAASVIAPNGADELDYSLTTSGDISGSFLDQMDLALGGGNSHLVAFDTSTPGMKSGMVTIASSSQAVQNGFINIPISYEVLGLLLAGDYNASGVVDMADYVLWRDTLGQNVANGTGADGSENGMIDNEDYALWRAHFGESTSSELAAAIPPNAVVPEPRAALLLFLGVCLAQLGGGTLRGWTRRS